MGKKPSPCSQSGLETNLKGHIRVLGKSPTRTASCFEADFPSLVPQLKNVTTIYCRINRCQRQVYFV